MMHEVEITTIGESTAADCVGCGAYSEWTGRDESSRRAAAVWKSEHEMEQG